jgi:phytoene synthase
LEQPVREAQEATVNIDAVRSSARLNAPDRYYAALFAPAAVRDDLIALAAFDGEIARVGQIVSDAALGEIRVAWWRDALVGGGQASELSGNPVLDQFADVVRRHQLSHAALDAYFEAHMAALFADPPADDAALDESFRAIDGTPLAFALQILQGPLDAGANTLIDAAGRASGLTRVARTLPNALAAGRTPLPEARIPTPPDTDWRPQIAWLAREARASLASVRSGLKGQARAFTTALLPLALIEPYFRALQKPGYDPSRDIVDIAPLARLWRIARAHWTGTL